MSNYPTQRPFFYNFFAAFRPYAAHKTPSAAATSASVAGPQQFSSNSQTQQSTSHTISPPTSPTGPHAQITQQATARAIAAKQQTPQPFQSAASAFSPSTHHTTRAQQTARKSPGPASPYNPSSFGGRNRRGSDSSSDNEGFVQRPGTEKWFIGGRMSNGEERFYQLSMVQRERSNDRRSCDRMSL